MPNIPATSPVESVFAPDQRSTRRFDVAIWTRLRIDGDAEYPARITNISSAGLMAMTPCPAVEGTTALIKIPEIGWVEAGIVWRMGDRTGVEFSDEIDPERFERLEPYFL